MRELTDDEIATLNTVRIFENVEPWLFKKIVRRVEWEHRIGTDPNGYEEMNLSRVMEDSGDIVERS